MSLKTISFSANSVEEIRENIENNSDFHPTLGFIFSSVALGIEKIPPALISSGIIIFGASTCGEILPSSGDDPIFEQSAVGCLLDLNPSFFAVSLFEKEVLDDITFGKQIGYWGSKIFEKPGFIIAVSGLKNNGEEISQGIIMASPLNTPVFGGMAGDDNKFEQTYVFSNDKHSTNGVIAIVFDLTKITISGMATSGWVGVGVEMIATSSQGNVLHTINNRPAIDIYKEYLNINDKALMKIGVLYPLLIKTLNGSPVLRAIMGADSNTGSLIFAGSIPEGSHVQFSSSFGYDIIEQSVQDIKDYHATHPDVDMILFFSCMARLKVAGQMIIDEIMIVSDLWKVPSCGFFTYGEINQDQWGTTCFYNETLTLVLIRLLIEEK